MKRCAHTGVIACLAAGWVGAAAASSDEAWAELRDRLVRTCTELAGDASVTVIPNEVGSDSYGVAMVQVPAGADLPPDIAICVLDKRSGNAELTVPMAPHP